MRIVPGLSKEAAPLLHFCLEAAYPPGNKRTGSRIDTFIRDKQRSDRLDGRGSMTDHNAEIASLKARLSKSGLTADDLAWFDSLEWRDTNVPPPAPDQVEQYKRREAALNADIAN